MIQSPVNATALAVGDQSRSFVTQTIRSSILPFPKLDPGTPDLFSFRHACPPDELGEQV